MTQAQKPDFVFRRNGRVHLNRRGRQFSRLLATEVRASAVIMLDTPCSDVVCRVLAILSIRQFPLHSPPVRHRVPSHFNWNLQNVFYFHESRNLRDGIEDLGMVRFSRWLLMLWTRVPSSWGQRPFARCLQNIRYRQTGHRRSNIMMRREHSIPNPGVRDQIYRETMFNACSFREDETWRYKCILNDEFVCLFLAHQPPSGPHPPHSRGFYITHNDATHSVGLLWKSDQLVAETST